MTKHACLLALGLAMAVPAFAAPLNYPRLPDHPSANQLVPEGWQITAQAEGDLNGDGLSDKALVLARNAKPGDANPDDDDHLMIVVVMAKSGGGYELALENHVLFYRSTDPYHPLEVTPVITHGTFRLKTECGCFGGDGSERLTFRWQQDHFNLIGYDYAYASRGSTVDASINYLTGIAQIGNGHVTHTNENDKSYRNGTIHFTPKKLLTFDEAGWGIEFLSKQLCPVGVKRFCS